MGNRAPLRDKSTIPSKPGRPPHTTTSHYQVRFSGTSLFTISLPLQLHLGPHWSRSRKHRRKAYTHQPYKSSSYTIILKSHSLTSPTSPNLPNILPPSRHRPD